MGKDDWLLFALDELLRAWKGLKSEWDNPNEDFIFRSRLIAGYKATIDKILAQLESVRLKGKQ